MKLDVPYKFLDTAPDNEFLNFNFDSITLNEWTEFKELQKLPVFKELYNYRILGTDLSRWFLPSADMKITYWSYGKPIHNFIMKEVEKLENLYNAKAVLGVLDGLPPGAKIARHFDMSPIFQKSHRVHLPLVTHPDVKFYIDDVEYYFPVGKFFEFDNSRFHEVKNNSDIFRIHLVVDLMPLEK